MFPCLLGMELFVLFECFFLIKCQGRRKLDASDSREWWTCTNLSPFIDPGHLPPADVDFFPPNKGAKTETRSSKIFLRRGGGGAKIETQTARRCKVQDTEQRIPNTKNILVAAIDTAGNFFRNTLHVT